MINQYYKVTVEYVQQSELVVGGADEEAVRKIVGESVIEGTKGFEILGIALLADEELEAVQHYLEMQGGSYDEDPLENPPEGLLN